LLDRRNYVAGGGGVLLRDAAPEDGKLVVAVTILPQAGFVEAVGGTR
jgi:ABC-type Zn uptake system ZnuABC Zn-binding protein ZnuA